MNSIPFHIMASIHLKQWGLTIHGTLFHFNSRLTFRLLVIWHLLYETTCLILAMIEFSTDGIRVLRAACWKHPFKLWKYHWSLIALITLINGITCSLTCLKHGIWCASFWSINGWDISFGLQSTFSSSRATSTNLDHQCWSRVERAV